MRWAPDSNGAREDVDLREYNHCHGEHDGKFCSDPQDSAALRDRVSRISKDKRDDYADRRFRRDADYDPQRPGSGQRRGVGAGAFRQDGPPRSEQDYPPGPGAYVGHRRGTVAPPLAAAARRVEAAVNSMRNASSWQDDDDDDEYGDYGETGRVEVDRYDFETFLDAAKAASFDPAQLAALEDDAATPAWRERMPNGDYNEDPYWDRMLNVDQRLLSGALDAWMATAGRRSRARRG